MANKRNYLIECRRRKGKDYTQKRVAQDLNISEVYVRMIENGTYLPGRDLMFKFLNYYNEPLNKLFPDYTDRIGLFQCAHNDN